MRTLSTLLESDWVIYPEDWAGFGMFSGVSSVCKGWNAVRVPHRAQQIPSPEGIFALTCVQSLWLRPSDARFAGCGLAAAEPFQVCGVAGSRSWLVGPPPAVAGFMRGVPFLVGAAGLAAYLFMVRICLDDMTWANFF